MGFNTVAVLYNDFMGELEKDGGRYGPQIAEAMRGLWYPKEQQAHRLSFGAGTVISQMHADGEQVVIVSRNSGVYVDDANDLGWMARDAMQRCLERHGYKVTKPRKVKPKADTRMTREQHDALMEDGGSGQRSIYGQG